MFQEYTSGVSCAEAEGDGTCLHVLALRTDAEHEKGELKMDKQEEEEMEDIPLRSMEETVFRNEFSDGENDEKEEETDRILKEYSFIEPRKNGVAEKCFDDNHEHIRSFVEEHKLRYEIRQAGIFDGLNNYIRSSLATWQNECINVAVTGNSGSGKSSLINALRNIKPNYPGAANVGIKETTTHIQKYEFPETDKVKLWDLPGVGTQKFSRKTYLEDTELSKFDIVVVVTANRFLENDIWIARQASRLGKFVIFVRTKIDFDLMNAKRDDPENFDEMKCLETIRRDIHENLTKSGLAELNDNIFLVSSPDRQKYDFTSLSESLKRLINTNGVRICKLLLHHLEKVIVEKREAVKCKFTGKKVASAIFESLPFPKLGTKLSAMTIQQMQELCLKIFCLDYESLQRVSQEVNISVRKLKEHHLKTFNTEQVKDVVRLYSETEDYRFPKFRKYEKYFAPVIGSVLSVFKGLTVAQDCLNVICNIMADDEFHLAQLRLHRLEGQLRAL